MESTEVTFWIIVWIVASLAGGLTALGIEKFRRWRTTKRILAAVREQIAMEDELEGGSEPFPYVGLDKQGRIASRPRN